MRLAQIIADGTATLEEFRAALLEAIRAALPGGRSQIERDSDGISGWWKNGPWLQLSVKIIFPAQNTEDVVARKLGNLVVNIYVAVRGKDIPGETPESPTVVLGGPINTQLQRDKLIVKVSKTLLKIRADVGKQLRCAL